VSTLPGMAWWCGLFVLWFRGRSSVVEHLLCKQGAVGSIPTVSIRLAWLVERLGFVPMGVFLAG
jgi:hypothetical protein